MCTSLKGSSKVVKVGKKTEGKHLTQTESEQSNMTGTGLQFGTETNAETPAELTNMLKYVDEQMPEIVSLEKAGYLLKNAAYSVDGKIGKKKEHSKSMQKVLDSLEAFSLMLDMSAEINAADPSEFETQIAIMEDRYRHIIMDCTSYEESHEPWSKEGKIRRAKVIEIRKLASDELLHIKSNAEYFKAGAQEGKSYTWRDIIREQRTQKYVDGKDGVKIGKAGGNTSQIHVISKTTDEKTDKKFFKEKEFLKSQTCESAIDEYVEKQSMLIRRIENGEDEFADMAQREKEDISRLASEKIAVAKSLHDYFTKIWVPDEEHKTAEEAYLDLFRRHNFETLEKYADTHPAFAETRFYKNFNATSMKREMQDTLILSKKQDIKKAARYRTGDKPSEEELQLRKDLIELQNDLSFLDKSVNVFNDIGKSLLSVYLAKNAPEIEEGRNMSERNVAASRLAKFLGIGSVVVGAEMSRVEIAGKKMDGVALDEAKGEEMNTVAVKYGPYKMSYSPEALEQLMNLQLFDVICGQTDRHDGNYMASVSVAGANCQVTEICAIDNDMSFGLMSYKRIVKDGDIGRLYSPEDKEGNCTIPAIGMKFAEQILALEPKVLSYLLGDILNKKELDALMDRISGVQEVLRKRLAYEKENPDVPSIFKKDKEDWVSFEKDIRTQTEKSSSKKPDIYKHSYLNPALMGAPGQV